MRKTLWILSLALLLATPGLALAEEGKWYGDFDEAAAVAKKEGKDLLVDFTGSDWCGWCIKLHKEVFAHEAFWKPAMEKFVLVALDFPRSAEVKARVPNPARNQELAQKYGIRGYPTVLLMTPEGEVFARTGYQAGGAEKYVEHLTEITAKGKKALADVKAVLEELDGAKPGEEAALVDKVVALLSGMTPESPGREALGGVAKGLLADQEAKAERRVAAALALLKAGIADEAVTSAAGALDPKNEHGVLERVVAAESGRIRSVDAVPPVLKRIEELSALGIHDKDLAIQLYTNAAFWNFSPRFNINDQEAAKKWARKAMDLGVENPRLKQFLERVLNG